jgi:hypothetical protein
MKGFGAKVKLVLKFRPFEGVFANVPLAGHLAK